MTLQPASGSQPHAHADDCNDSDEIIDIEGDSSPLAHESPVHTEPQGSIESERQSLQTCTNSRSGQKDAYADQTIHSGSAATIVSYSEKQVHSDAEAADPLNKSAVSRQNDRNKKNKRKTASKGSDAESFTNLAPSMRPHDLGIKPKPKQFDPVEVANLANQHPDTYWSHESVHEDPHSMIAYIGTDCPLELVKNNSIRDRSPITGMTLSPDGSMLVTFSNSGSACFWDLDNFSLVQMLRDADEENIDEYYVGRFTPDSRLIVIGGKLKDRHRWSDQDEDNHILPCPLKVFDVVTGKVIEKFYGHDEEILCIKSVVFKDENYFISTSQDGYIIKWHISEDWSQLLERTWMKDGVTCMAFNVSFLPHTGNKYFVAACDDSIRLYDFEHSQLQQTFPGIYSYYCDCVKVVQCQDYPQPPSWSDVISNMTQADGQEMFAYIIDRGVETLDAEDNTINSIPNTVKLHKLVYPRNLGGSFRLEEIMKFSHELYRSNSWLIKVTSNGRYVAAPTYDGNVCLFHLRTGELVGILQDHDGIEVRDVIFHPNRKLLLTSADDGTVKAYQQVNSNEM